MVFISVLGRIERNKLEAPGSPALPPILCPIGTCLSYSDIYQKDSDSFALCSSWGEILTFCLNIKAGGFCPFVISPTTPTLSWCSNLLSSSALDFQLSAFQIVWRLHRKANTGADRRLPLHRTPSYPIPKRRWAAKGVLQSPGLTSALGRMVAISLRLACTSRLDRSCVLIHSLEVIKLVKYFEAITLIHLSQTNICCWMNSDFDLKTPPKHKTLAARR